MQYTPSTLRGRPRSAFTLVEIMIVVVIIGLLAAIAIPAFNKVQRTSRTNTLLNDGRQIGNAAQQYFLETGFTTVAVGVNSDGTVTGPLTDYVRRVGTGYTLNPNSIQEGADFTLTHVQVNDNNPVFFDAQGRHRTAEEVFGP